MMGSTSLSQFLMKSMVLFLGGFVAAMIYLIWHTQQLRRSSGQPWHKKHATEVSAEILRHQDAIRMGKYYAITMLSAALVNIGLSLYLR